MSDRAVLYHLVLALVLFTPVPFASAQQPAPTVITSGGKVIQIEGKPGSPATGAYSPPSGQVPGQPSRPTGPPGSAKPPETSKSKPAQPDMKKGPDQKKGTTPGKEDEKSDVLKRPEKPDTPADPNELKVRPDKDGIVHFQFQGQAWPDVLEWFAAVSGLSVDWQELPNDFINISTQRGYSIEETRDVLNRLLLARGFTLLKDGEFLTVVKCDQLNTSLVPRVTTEQLDELLPHEFVKVMFQLDWLLAEEAARELEPLLSKNGKLLPLKTTNRLEAIDAAVNLREIGRLLKEEQIRDGDEPRMVREFVLEYARADELREQLKEFLGVTSGPAGMPKAMSSSQMRAQQKAMQMQMQQMQQMQQQQRKSKTPVPRPKAQEKPIRLLVNSRRNSILVQAPPDKMVIITEAIKLLDVPGTGATSLQAFLGRMRVYRLTQLDPEKLVKSLQELGNMDPSTRLEVDQDNRAIIAYATPADHFTIQSIVEKLDGSARHVEVIPLRRLAADEVAGTIQYLMAGTDQEDSNQSRYRGYMYGYSSSRRQDNKANDSFRVDADVVNNRLLVRANDVELEEVLSILVKLGEIPHRDQPGELTRVLDITPGENVDAFLNELESRWKLLSPNPLVLPPKKPKKQTTPPTQPSTPAPATKPAVDEPATADHQRNIIRTAQFQRIVPDDEDSPPAVAKNTAESSAPSASPTGTLMATPELKPQSERDLPVIPEPITPETADGTPAPIVITVKPNGQLVISSKDMRALDAFEQLAARLAPPRKGFEVFKLEYASATWVALNLEEFFEDEDETENRRQGRMMSWMYGMPTSGGSGSSQRRLSKRQPLKFISDLDTNTILVQGADADQLATITELVKLYDVPEPTTSQTSRVTKLFQIHYSKASIVAETLKEAYRDLLSANDKSLQKGKQENGSQGAGSRRVYMSPFGFSGDSQSQERTSIRFKGKLSIGVDDLSNTLLISAEGESLMRIITDMVEALDEAAKPVSQVRVVKLQAGTDGARLQKALAKVLGAEAKSRQPTGKSPQGPQSGRPGSPGMGMPQVMAAPKR